MYINFCSTSYRFGFILPSERYHVRFKTYENMVGYHSTLSFRKINPTLHCRRAESVAQTTSIYHLDVITINICLILS